MHALRSTSALKQGTKMVNEAIQAHSTGDFELAKDMSSGKKYA